MREYELTVVYDLAVQEAGGPDASVELLTNMVTARGGKVLKVDHWGRRRMAYPINRAIDGDYLVSRVELEPGAVAPLEAALGIDERVYRHLVVRADELPIPPPPREPRREPAAAATGPSEAAPAVAPTPGSTTPAAAEEEAPSPEAAPEPAVAEAEAPSPEAAPEPAAAEAEAPSPEAAPEPAAEETATAVADVTGVTEEPADSEEAAALGAEEASPEPVEAPGEETDEGKAPPSGTIATDESD